VVESVILQNLSPHLGLEVRQITQNQDFINWVQRLKLNVLNDEKATLGLMRARNKIYVFPKSAILIFHVFFSFLKYLTNRYASSLIGVSISCFSQHSTLEVKLQSFGESCP